MSLEKHMKKRDTLLVIDIYNLIFRTLSTAHKADPLDEKFILWKSMMVERIIDYIDLFKADKVVIAIDDKHYWRKDIYPNYKVKRKLNRAKSKIDFDKFWPVMESFFIELKDAFGFMMFIKVENCEADDIIAVLTKEKWKNYKVICLSNDSDLNQLYKYKYYKQYNPLKKQYFNPINPKKDLLIKILTGDIGDNIPNVAYRCGEVKAQSFLNEGLDVVFKKDPEIEEKFKRNKQLIDLDMIPPKIVQKISDNYDTYNINKYSGRKIFNFLTDHNLRGVIENFERYSKRLMTLS